VSRGRARHPDGLAGQRLRQRRPPRPRRLRGRRNFYL
jgi:hypothetical protein